MGISETKGAQPYKISNESIRLLPYCHKNFFLVTQSIIKIDCVANHITGEKYEIDTKHDSNPIRGLQRVSRGLYL